MISWFMGTRFGQTIAAILGALVVFGLALLKAFYAGKASEQAKQQKNALDSLRERNKIDDEASKNAPSDNRRKLAEWMRGDK